MKKPKEDSDQDQSDDHNEEPAMPRFSLDKYELIRAPDETDDEYEARLNLFRE